MRVVSRVKPAGFVFRVLVTLYAFLGAIFLLKHGHPASAGGQLACVLVAGFLVIAIGLKIEHRIRVASSLAPTGSIREILFLLKYDLSRLKNRVEAAQIDRSLARVQRRASTARRGVLRVVLEQIEIREKAMKRGFPAVRRELLERTSLLTVTLLEDDSDPVAYLLVMDVLEHLGFVVNVADEHADFLSFNPRPIWRFERVKTDYLVIGPNVADHSVRQFVQEVHTWEAPPALYVKSIADNETLISAFFGPVFQDLPADFTALALSQLWISLKFWQAHGEQRHRFLEAADPRSSRSLSGNS